MAKKYDVIVVGAGPAGFLAAKAAGENGLEVALLEKKTDVTSFNRSCAQTLVSMTEPYLGNLVIYNPRDKLISFSNDGFSSQDAAVWYLPIPTTKKMIPRPTAIRRLWCQRTETKNIPAIKKASKTIWLKLKREPRPTPKIKQTQK